MLEQRNQRPRAQFKGRAGWRARQKAAPPSGDRPTRAHIGQHAASAPLAAAHVFALPAYLPLFLFCFYPP
ncbi:MAG: hypothetical protein FWG10_09315, partial [Eubacteriaceae bacterium]|nr:hypothetical protein [Eubacteriaceae bacterium]